MTELQLTYDLLKAIRSAEINDDERISERYIRFLLNKHRPKIINIEYDKGLSLLDYLFQEISVVQQPTDEPKLVKINIPNLLHFKNNYGVRIKCNGEYISVVSREEYHNSLKNRYNKYHQKAYLENGYVFIYDPGATINYNKIKIEGILSEPENGKDYDWTKSPYPFPDHLLGQLSNTILSREFNIILQTKADKIMNNENKSTEYRKDKT